MIKSAFHAFLGSAVGEGHALLPNGAEFEDLWPCGSSGGGTTLGGVAYFFRIVEQVDGSWSSRRGRANLDRFEQLDEAIEHTTSIASAYAPAEVFVHHFDGRVQNVATFD